MSAGDLMGWRTHVHPFVVKDEIFDVDELAGQPEAVAGVGEMGPGDPALPNGASGKPLIKPCDGVLCSRKRCGF